MSSLLGYKKEELEQLVDDVDGASAKYRNHRSWGRALAVVAGMFAAFATAAAMLLTANPLAAVALKVGVLLLAAAGSGVLSFLQYRKADQIYKTAESMYTRESLGLRHRTKLMTSFENPSRRNTLFPR